jgi:hypothetical protein
MLFHSMGMDSTTVPSRMLPAHKGVMPALLKAAEGQQVASASKSLASMVAVGVSVEAQLAVQSACIARQQECYQRLSPN